MHPNDALVRAFLLLWGSATSTSSSPPARRTRSGTIGRSRPRSAARGSREFVQRFVDVPGGPYEILLQVADDRVVMNERLDRATFGGHLAELRACGVFEIEAGRIKAWRDDFDTGSLAADDHSG